MANNNNKKYSGMKMPGEIKVLPDKKPVENKPVQAAAPKPMFNSRWRMLGTPQNKD